MSHVDPTRYRWTGIRRSYNRQSCSAFPWTNPLLAGANFLPWRDRHPSVANRNATPEWNVCSGLSTVVGKFEHPLLQARLAIASAAEWSPRGTGVAGVQLRERRREIETRLSRNRARHTPETVGLGHPVAHADPPPRARSACQQLTQQLFGRVLIRQRMYDSPTLGGEPAKPHAQHRSPSWSTPYYARTTTSACAASSRRRSEANREASAAFQAQGERQLQLQLEGLQPSRSHRPNVEPGVHMDHDPRLAKPRPIRSSLAQSGRRSANARSA